MQVSIQERLHVLLEMQRAAFHAERMPSLAVRRDRVQRVLTMTAKYADDITSAISHDFGHRAAQESQLADIFTVESAARHTLRHLRRWMKPRRMPTALHFWPARNELLRQPLGVVGVISPWNYPYSMALIPAVAALAAGNRVLIKPSELTPQTAALMARMVTSSSRPTSCRSSQATPRSAGPSRNCTSTTCSSPAPLRSGGLSHRPPRNT